MSFKLQEPEDMLLKFEYAKEIDFSFVDTNKLGNEEFITSLHKFVEKHAKEIGKPV